MSERTLPERWEWAPGMLARLRDGSSFSGTDYRLEGRVHPTYPDEHDWPHDIGMRFPVLEDDATWEILQSQTCGPKHLRPFSCKGPPTDEDFEPPEPEAGMNGLEGAVRVAREIGCGLSLTPDQVAALYCQLDVPPPAAPESKPDVPRVVILPDGLVYELGRCVGVHEPTVLGRDL